MVSTLKRSKCWVNYHPGEWVPWRRSKCCVAEYSRARDATLSKSRLTCPLKDDLEQTRKTSNMQVSIRRGERTMRRKENRVGLGKTLWRKPHSGRSRRVLVNVTESKAREVSHWDHSWHFYHKCCFVVEAQNVPTKPPPVLWECVTSRDHTASLKLKMVPRVGRDLTSPFLGACTAPSAQGSVGDMTPSLPLEDVSPLGFSGFSPLPCKSMLRGWYNYQSRAWPLAGPLHVSSGWTRCTLAVEATFPSTLWWSPRCMELTPASCVLCP